MRRRREAPLRQWVGGAVPADVTESLRRLRRRKDVQYVAVMPDVHLAKEVCIGTAVATSHLLYPSAVGGDVGCGMAAVAFDGNADVVRDAGTAQKLLQELREVVPILRHHRPPRVDWLENTSLSDGRLDKLKDRDGRVQIGTLGRGNHFLELQEDEDDGRLWLMVHSGSRSMGQAIRSFHTDRASGSSSGARYLSSDSDAGRAYLHDVAWAREYAEISRRLMIGAVGEVMQRLVGVSMADETYVGCDHNHVQQETHFGELVWVHRKGALEAQKGQPGVIPGSMGTRSFHVRGRGCKEALCSSSHGAGRSKSRSQARRQIRTEQLWEEMDGVEFDSRLASRLRDEAPSAYKNVDQVMRAQRKLTCATRRLRPVLVYKGV